MWMLAKSVEEELTRMGKDQQGGVPSAAGENN